MSSTVWNWLYPRYAGLYLSGLTPGTLVGTNDVNALQSLSIANANGCNTTLTGSTLTCTLTQDLSATGSPRFTGLSLGGLLISPSSSTAQIQLQTLSYYGNLVYDDTTGMSLVDWNGTYLRLKQGVVTTSTATLDDGKGAAILTGLTLSGVSASLPLKTNASKQAVTGLINLTSEVTGILPVANGGTGSGGVLSNNRILVSSGGAIAEAAALTDGQLLFGITGGAPLGASVVGTTNRISATWTGTQLTLTTPQATHTGAVPVFAGLALSGLTATRLLASNGTNALQSVTIANANGCSTSFAGSTLTCQLDTASSPTLTGLTLSGLTATRLLASNGASALQSVTISNANGANFSFAGTTLTCTLSQDLQTTASPQFAGLNVQSTGITATLTLTTTGGSTSTLSRTNGVGTELKDVSGGGYVRIVGADTTVSGNLTVVGLTASMPIKTNASSKLVSSLINLTTDVTGILPVANGGTGGGSALNNNRIIVSSGGALTEAAALTAGQLLFGVTGSAPLAASIVGTANRVTATWTGTQLTLNGPQDLDTTASPNFRSLTCTSNTTTATLSLITSAGQVARLEYANGIGVRISDVVSGVNLVLNSSGMTTPVGTFVTLTSTNITGTTINATDFKGATLTTTGAIAGNSVSTYAVTTTLLATSTFTQSTSMYFEGTSTTAVASGGFTMISWTTSVIQDSSSMYSSALNRWTIGVTGKYRVHAQLRLDDQAVAANDSVGIRIYLNGAGSNAQAFVQPDGSGRRTVDVRALMSLTLGDYLQIAGYQNSGVSVNAQRGYFEIVKVDA